MDKSLFYNAAAAGKWFDCTVNGVPLATYGGAALLDYSIGETQITPDTFQGVNRTSWNLLENMFHLRDITMTVVFEAHDLRTAKLNRSALNGVLFEKADIYIPDDGFHYTVICTSMGAEELVGIGFNSAQVKSTYAFKGVRHDDLKTVTLASGETLYCQSTIPFTDCRLTATVGSSASSYQLGGAIFGSVTAGDVLVFDGIDGKITKNGVNYAASVSWFHFPQLTPGANTITCPDAITVEYYPTYI